jgi:hypothetical protein
VRRAAAEAPGLAGHRVGEVRRGGRRETRLAAAISTQVLGRACGTPVSGGTLMTSQEQQERLRPPPPLHAALALSMNDSASAASTSPIRVPRDHNTFRRMLAILDTLGYPTDDAEPEVGGQCDAFAPDWADTPLTQR